MLKMWDKKTNIIQPDGIEYTPEQIMADPNFGFTRFADTVLEQQGPITVAIDNLATLLMVHGLDESLQDQEALDAILQARKEQQEQARAQDSQHMQSTLDAFAASTPEYTELKQTLAELAERVKKLENEISILKGAA